MGSTLAQLEARTAEFLMDASALIWPTATLEESLRLALQEYSQATPCGQESVVTLPGAGREIALAELDGLLDVLEVWWAYDSDASTEAWPPNRVKGFRLWWDDAQPVLHLSSTDQSQPALGDEVRIWWSAPHTIQDLDAADHTTVPTAHDTLLVLGAAGHACFARSVGLAETVPGSTTSTPNLAALGSRFLREFRYLLGPLQKRGSTAGGEPFGQGWRLDSWDGTS